MDNFQAYHIIRFSTLAFMLAAVVSLWYMSQPTWDMVVSVMEGHSTDHTISGMMAAALMVMVLCFAGRSGPYRTNRLERYVITSACGVVIALVAWMVILLLDGPIQFYWPALVGCIAICALMVLRVIWVIQSAHPNVRW